MVDIKTFQLIICNICKISDHLLFFSLGFIKLLTLKNNVSWSLINLTFDQFFYTIVHPIENTFCAISEKDFDE